MRGTKFVQTLARYRKTNLKGDFHVWHLLSELHFHLILSGTSKNYIRAIEEFGGTVRRLYPGVPDFKFADIDGLLLTGGGDIHPKHFGQPCHPSLKYVKEARDELELPLCRQSIKNDLPVFGICRGIQVMSVAIARSSLYTKTYPLKVYGPFASSSKRANSMRIQSMRLRLFPTVCSSKLIGDRASDRSQFKLITNQWTKLVKGLRCHGAICRWESLKQWKITSKEFVMLGVQYHPERMTKEPGSSEFQRTPDVELFTRSLFNACLVNPLASNPRASH